MIVAAAGCIERYPIAFPLESTIDLTIEERVKYHRQMWLVGSTRHGPGGWIDYTLHPRPGELSVQINSVKFAPSTLQTFQESASFRIALDIWHELHEFELIVRYRHAVDHYHVRIDWLSVEVKPIGRPAFTQFLDDRWERAPTGLVWYYARPNANTRATSVDPARVAEFEALLSAAGCQAHPLRHGFYKSLKMRVDTSGHSMIDGFGGWQSAKTYRCSGTSGDLARAYRDYDRAHDSEAWFYLGDEGGGWSTK